MNAARVMSVSALRVVLVGALLSAAGLVGLMLALVAAERPAEAAFPGENGRIAFSSTRTSGDGVDNPTGDLEIFTVNPDGSGLLQVTNNTTDDEEPAFSADGTKIAYSGVDGSEGGGDREIFTIGLEGGEPAEPTNVTDDDVALDTQPTWSPDGSKIAYASGSESERGPRRIYKIDAEGGTPTLIAFQAPCQECYFGAAYHDPAWSPDGSKIAYIESSRSSHIAIIDPDGNHVGGLSGSFTYLSSVDWTPSGTKLFYVSDDGSIYSARTEWPRNETRLTNGFDPAFSPDGSKIAYGGGGSSGDDRGVYLASACGGGPSKILDDPNARSLDWQSVSASPTTSDTTAPTITLCMPQDGAIYALDQQVHADYVCADEAGGSGVASCEGTVANDAAIATSSGGTHTFTVTATDEAGNTTSVTRSYTVRADCTIVGTQQDDHLQGESGDDTICGLGGNDYISGNYGNDILKGGPGDDYFPDNSNDNPSEFNTVKGGSGNDTMSGGSNSEDTLEGGDGNDQLFSGGEGDDTVNGGAGTDVADFSQFYDWDNPSRGVKASLVTNTATSGAATYALHKIENLVGSGGSDVLVGSDGKNILSGMWGNDTLEGGAGNDELSYHEGEDTLHGGTGTDVADFSGYSHWDPSRGVEASLVTNTALVANSDIFIQSTSALRDIENLVGTSGRDLLVGSDGKNVLRGGERGDRIRGGPGNDSVVGEAGVDDLYGESGDDAVDSKDGVRGNDLLSGGSHVNGDTKVTDAAERSIVGFP